MKKHACLTLVLSLGFILTACNAPVGVTPTPNVAEMVVETFEALTPQISPTSELPAATSTATATATEALAVTPTLTASPTSTTQPTATERPEPGSISGSIYGYPYGSLPSLTIVAFHQGSTYHWYTITGYGETSFIMDNYIYPPGNYVVVAYDASGNSGGCPGVVKVVSEQTASCDISDWASSFPSKPGDVP